MNAIEHTDHEPASWPLLPFAVRVKRPGTPALWLPLFIFWPLIIAAFCLAIPLCVVWPAPRGSALAVLGATYHMLCALHGTQVEIDDGDSNWNISLY